MENRPIPPDNEAERFPRILFTGLFRFDDNRAVPADRRTIPVDEFNFGK